MFLAKSVLVIVALIGAVNCGKWNRPPRYSSESISTSVSSEEYHGGSLPPLQLSGVPLPSPVHANSVGTPTYTTFTPRPNTLSSPHFAELVKFNAPLINQSVGGNQQLSHVSKVRQIPLPDSSYGEMYYVKGYFITEQGYRNKCSFFLYSKESAAQVMDAHCH